MLDEVGGYQGESFWWLRVVRTRSSAPGGRKGQGQRRRRAESGTRGGGGGEGGAARPRATEKPCECRGNAQPVGQRWERLSTIEKGELTEYGAGLGWWFWADGQGLYQQSPVVFVGELARSVRCWTADACERVRQWG